MRRMIAFAALIVFVALVAVTLFFAAGCGGSGSSTPTGVPASSTFYIVNLPNGSQMSLDLSELPGGEIEGDFLIDSAAGDTAHSSGEVGGTSSGDALNLTCESLAGDQFTLVGSAISGGKLSLTLSTIGGAPLVFIPQAAQPSISRDTVTFRVQFSPYSTGTVTLPAKPSYTYTSGTKRYTGDWNNTLDAFRVEWTVFTNNTVFFVMPTNNYTQVLTDFPNAGLGTSASTGVNSEIDCSPPLTSNTVYFSGGTFKVLPR